MLQIGDWATLKYSFRIVDYNLQTELMTIIVVNDNNLIRLIIPIWQSNLGLYPIYMAWTVPGDYLPISHPDYYAIIKYGSSGMLVQSGGEIYKLVIDKDFNYTGKYYLWGENDDAPVIVYAQKRNRDEISSTLAGMLNTTMDGKIIQGKLIHIVVQKAQGGYVWPNQYMQELNINVDDKTFVIIKDTITNVEYPLPIKLITT